MCRIVGFITKRKFIELRQDLVEQKIKEHLAGEKNHQYHAGLARSLEVGFKTDNLQGEKNENNIIAYARIIR